MTDRVSLFTDLTFGDGEKTPLSGPGSTLDRTKTIRQILSDMVRTYDIKTMIDAPCGDLTWMSHFLKEHPALQYTGYDASQRSLERASERLKAMNINNATLINEDIVKTTFPKVDLIFERDGLQHLSNGAALQILKNYANSGSTFLLATMNLTHYNQWNRNIEDGGYRPINLLLPPFRLPSPIAIFAEQHGSEGLQHYGQEKYTGLWLLNDIKEIFARRA